MIFWFYDFLGEFVNLAGWGLKYDPKTNQYAVESTLKLANLEVNSREVCEEIFGKDNLRDNDINVRLLQRQIPRGFTSDITCVGNDFDVEQGKRLFQKNGYTFATVYNSKCVTLFLKQTLYNNNK